MQNIRNFCIIAHVDHGKSTLADRLLELTGTIEKRKMHEQFLDQMELERERGITIKLQPVRMMYRRPTQTDTQTHADFLYGELTYKIRGLIFAVKKNLGLGHKEIIYQKALESEFLKNGLIFEKEKAIDIFYGDKKVGIYRPDFVIEEKVILELKSLPFIGKIQEEQLWSYLKRSLYKLALLINFGGRDIEIKRVVYDSARGQRESALSRRESAEVEYTLNLIDTPGHVDFSYEVSRSLAAVEGAILLVDAAKGVQAQTLANLHLAQKQGLTIIPVINKIDLPNARVVEVEEEIQHLLPAGKAGILKISAKTGEGVERVLEAVIEQIPSPGLRESASGLPRWSFGEAGQRESAAFRALIFDSIFDTYKGIIAYVRVFDGSIKAGERIKLFASREISDVVEVGYFKPRLQKESLLSSGEIGYIATGLKIPGQVRVGDTIFSIAETRRPDAEIRRNFPRKSALAPTPKLGVGVNQRESAFVPLPGYKEPRPVVFASFYPEQNDDYDTLKDALSKLKLTDASLIYEPESSPALGRGFRLGFLGMLHIEIISERLRREFGLKLVISTPSVEYHVTTGRGEVLKVRSAGALPDPSHIQKIEEPIVNLEILSPATYMGQLMKLVAEMRSQYTATDYLSKEAVMLKYKIPLAEIITDFYDRLKSVSSGYASMSYNPAGYQTADMVRLDILVAGELVEPFSKITPREQAYHEGKRIVEKLKTTIPPQLFAVTLQAAIGGKIVAREDIRAMRKDVTGYLYGGDVTRKKKLLEKQKRGKAKMKERGRVEIPQSVFLEMLKR